MSIILWLHLGVLAESFISRDQTLAIDKQRQPTVFITYAGAKSGFGNRLMYVSFYAELTRAANRSLAISGPSVIWADYWKSSFVTNFDKYPTTSTHLREDDCETRSDGRNDCFDAFASASPATIFSSKL